MKKLLLILAVSGMIMTACSNEINIPNNGETDVNGENGVVVNDIETEISEPSEEENKQSEDEQQVIEDISQADNMQTDVEYLTLNKTSIQELLDAKNYSLSYDEYKNTIDSGTLDLGNVKIGNSIYKLVFAYDKNEGQLILTDSVGKESKITDDVSNNLLDYELYLYNNKYLLVAMRDWTNDGICSYLAVYDENGNRVIGNSLYYDNYNKKFDYEVQEDKISLSAYEPITLEMKEKYNLNDLGFKNLYRVYYEIVEKDGELEVNKIREDIEDLSFTAATV